MRVAAFGRLALVAAALLAGVSGATFADEWIISRSEPEAGSPVLVGVQLAGGPSFDAGGNEFWPSLVIRCSFGRIEAAINWRIAIAATDGRAPILVRMDDLDTTTESWSVGADPARTERPDAGRWLTRLLAAKRLFARAAAADGTRIDANFDLQGLPAFADEVADGCGWKLKPDRRPPRHPR